MHFILFILILIFCEIKSESEITKKTADFEVKPFGKDDYKYSEQQFKNLLNSTTGLKANQSEKKIYYYLYTKKNPIKPDQIFTGNTTALKKSNFLKKVPLKVVFHGYMANYQSSFPATLKSSYLNPQTEDLNVILVDYSAYSGEPYESAVLNVAFVSETIAKFVKFLVDQNSTTVKRVHFIGHSLGAHVAGDTGYYVKKTTGRRVSRVTGSDPANPLFGNANERGRIDPSDGNFVDIVHTSGLTLGILRSLGHADFYPNGGEQQPGCFFTDIGCSHDRAFKYFAESILYPRGFRACKCIGNQLRPSKCKCNGNDSTAFMGEYLSKSTRGVFYLKTNRKPLYGKG